MYIYEGVILIVGVLGILVCYTLRCAIQVDTFPLILNFWTWKTTAGNAAAVRNKHRDLNPLQPYFSIRIVHWNNITSEVLAHKSLTFVGC